MAISATLARVESVLDALVGHELEPVDTHPVLLRLAEVLGRPPYAVVGPRARFRWRIDDLMVEAGVDRFLGVWEVGYRAFPYEPDVSRGEYLAFAYGGEDVSPPYEWSLDLGGPQPRLPHPAPLTGWERFATELGYLVGKLPEDLSTIPPDWFDGTVVVSTFLDGVVVEAAADRHGLTVSGPANGPVRLDPEQAYRAAPAIGVAWAGTYAGHSAGDLVLRGHSVRRPFALLTSPRAAEEDPPELPPVGFADLPRLSVPVRRAEQGGATPPTEPCLATYATTDQAAALVLEVVRDGVSAFLHHHALVAGAQRPGVPELRSKAGWRARVLSGSILLTLVEGHGQAAAVRSYTHRLLELLEESFGSPWGSSLDTQGRLSRTWRTGDLALRVGSSGSSVMVEITSYADLLTYHFG